MPKGRPAKLRLPLILGAEPQCMVGAAIPALPWPRERSQPLPGLHPQETPSPSFPCTEAGTTEHPGLGPDTVSLSREGPAVPCAQGLAVAPSEVGHKAILYRDL